ncbi:hypothetical protein V6N11_074043 [Hibiscus sabdariffa]|uniref:Reverse transcriptase n=2 Tax=Hibiscus sabdariffa TaxID=183260 RepID=A0ABR2P5W8_9ROSI
MASAFFQDLFHTSAPTEASEILNLVQPPIDEELNRNLMEPFHTDEIRAAVFRECINIWDDPWIPGPGDGRVRCNAIDIRYTAVADLTEEVDKSWKYDVLKDLFDAEQVSRISSIPLSRARLLDEIVWRYDDTGNFSAKSGYRLLRAEQARTLSTKLSSFFTDMWATNVLAKVKITMWRIVNNFLPTFHNLQLRRLPVNNVCPFCQSHGETVEHLFRDCAFVKLLMWKLALPSVSIQDAGLWKDWIASFFHTLTVRNKRVLLVLYWSVWFSRNKLVHEGIHTSADESVTFIEACIREQETLGRLLPKSIPMRESYWQAPPESAIKFNFDSTFNSRSGFATTGVIGRNNRGLIMAACSFPHRKVADVFAAEAYACKQALLFAKDLGFPRVIIEGDSLTIIKKINSDSADRSSIYPIVRDIKFLTRSFTSISFRFVRREANNAAHALARECRNYLDPRYWMEQAPEAATMASELDRSRLPQSNIL